MKKIDFSKECTVIFFLEDSKGNDVRFTYERPQFVSDQTLTEEAMKNFENMKKKKLHDVRELKAIFIARNEKDYHEYVSSVSML